MNHNSPYHDCAFTELTRGSRICPACNRPVYMGGKFDFTNTIVDRTRDFTGRDWVFRRINDWLAHPNRTRLYCCDHA
jgi:hypothetical protein